MLVGGLFDLVFIDVDKENNVVYIQWVIWLVWCGVVIVVDNVICGGGIFVEFDDVDVVVVCWML